ncbi:hypothetical protein CTE05_39990 [Cellulomonas terrae]|uniref:Uncharacterized protein n=1 Tax=Cellulomonas terrae TaxID=311234 RepID=A0A511JQY9_9CELL|nr:hypothetical protein CTE05_39990 [Cellulomonas terrae]
MGARAMGGADAGARDLVEHATGYPDAVVLCIQAYRESVIDDSIAE